MQMTFRQLEEALSKLTEEQKDMKAIVLHGYDEETFKVSSLFIAYKADSLYDLKIGDPVIVLET